jgi:hypothetical protein
LLHLKQEEIYMAKAKKRVVKKAKKRVVKKAKSTRKKVKVLPCKMSALIKIALKDIRKAEASQKFIIDMDDWYRPDTELNCMLHSQTVVERHKVCVACAAGSVMAFSLGLGSDSNSANADKLLHSESNGRQLMAINELRVGQVAEAAKELELLNWDYDMEDNPEAWDSWDKQRDRFRSFDTTIPDYDNLDPEPFHKEMGKLQAKLEKAGL